MSVDWFIQKFRNEDPAEFRKSSIKEAFGSLERKEAIVEDTEWWDLDCGSSMTMGEVESEYIESTLINRPAFDDELISSIFSVLEEEGMILFSPNLDCPHVAHKNTRGHLPGDMIESLGEPIFASTWEELKQRI